MEGKGPHQDSLLENIASFKSSKDPARIMYFGGGEWKDFPLDQFQSLKSGFMDGKTAVEVPMDGKPSVVGFLGMTQTDLATGAARSVAWIDVDGRCFFPRRTVGGEWPGADRCVGGQPSGLVKECSDASSGMYCGRPRWSGAEEVSCRDGYYRVVERAFLAGMRRLDPNVVVTSISKCAFSGPIGDARKKGFWAMAGATKVARGNANLTFGWFGASKDGVERILQHGFGLQDVEVSDDESYGRGVRLVRLEFLYKIFERSVADPDRERHVLLCRVIAGAAEKVELGSCQCEPSCQRFDSGVDDIPGPRWCIVWSTHMNTHVIPECVVSFRLSDHPQCFQVRKMAAPAKKESPTTNMSFSQLLAELEKSLSPSAMRTLDLLFDRYKAKKIQKEVFIKRLRTIAGNKLLLNTIKKIRDRF